MQSFTGVGFTVVAFGASTLSGALAAKESDVTMISEASQIFCDAQ